MHGATIGRNQIGNTLLCTPNINNWIRDLQCGVLNNPQSKARRIRLWHSCGELDKLKSSSCFRQVVSSLLLELENSRASLAGVIPEPILHSQLFTIDIKKLKQCRMFGQKCGKGKQQSKYCFRNKDEVSTPND